MPHSTRFSAPWLTVAFYLVAGCYSVPAPSVPDLMMTDVTVIDTAHGVRAHQDVTLHGNKISAVRAHGPGAPAAKRVIDGSGKFVIPGLWDMHVHTTYDPPITGAMPDLFLSYGITSVRDTGGLVDELEPVVARWRAPGATAPRLFYSGPLLDGAKVVYDGVGRPEIGVANPVESAARENIARLKQAGVDFVKIYELVAPEVFEALVSAAREAELPIAAHVPLAVSAEQAGRSVDSMEHLRNIDLACATSAAEQLEERRSRLLEPGDVSGYELRRSLHAEHHGRAREAFHPATCDRVLTALGQTTQVPTLRLNTVVLYPPFARKDWFEHVERLPEEARMRWAATATQFAEAVTSLDASLGHWSMELVGRLHRAGVPIGAGTDTPIGLALPGYSLHTELERLVEAGLTPLEALASATVRPAEFFGLEDQMGQVARGQAADLVLLKANPLTDIRNTRRIHTVISRGRVVREP